MEKENIMKIINKYKKVKLKMIKMMEKVNYIMKMVVIMKVNLLKVKKMELGKNMMLKEMKLKMKRQI